MEGCTQFFGLELEADLTDVACSVVDSSLLADGDAARQLRRALQANATLEVRTQVSGTGSMDSTEGFDASLIALVNDNEQAFLDALATAGEADSQLYFATVTSAVASDPGTDGGGTTPGGAPAPPPTALAPTPLPPTESDGDGNDEVDDGDDDDDKLSGGAIFGIIAACLVALYVVAYIMWKSGRDDKEDAKEATEEDDIDADEKARTVAVADGAAAGAAATPDTPQALESSKKLEEKKPSPEGTTVTMGVAEDSASNGRSTKETETLTVMAPAGKLGIVLDTTLMGPMVNKVKPESPMAGKLFSGDVIVKIGDEETRAMNAAAINAIMIRTANAERTLIVMRPALENIGDGAPPPPPPTVDKVPPAALVPTAAMAAAIAATPNKKKSVAPPKKATDIGAMEKHVIKAPAGKMGIVIDTSLEGPMIHSVKADGPMAGKLLPGDIIVKIGEESTRAMNSTAINALMIKTSTAERKLTIMRTPAASSTKKTAAPKKKAAPKTESNNNAVVVPAMVSKFDKKVNEAAKHAKKSGESEENEDGWSSEESEA